MAAFGAIVMTFGLSCVAGLIYVPLLLLTMWIKKLISHMDGPKWTAYFKQVDNPGAFIRLGAIFAAGAALMSVAGYYLFTFFHYKQPFMFALLAFCFSLLRFAFKMTRNRKMLKEKLSELHSLDEET